MIDPERIQRLAAKLGNRSDALEFVRQMRCGGRKFDGGGRYFRTNLRDESPMAYEPMMPVYPEVSVPERYYPQPNYGDYEYPVSTGMIQSMPIQVDVPVSAPMTGVLADEVSVPVSDLFSDEAIARRALKQRYAESSFNDRAVSKAGAQGAWQIMPITLKDYLGRGRGKAGDLNDPEYNRKVRDWVMGIIPRDLKEFWSESDSDRAKLAKLYAAYNWGAGNLRSFLRKKQKAGVDISNPDNWVDDLNPETRRYVRYLAFDEDIPDSTAYTNSAFEKAAMERGYLRCGGKLYGDGGDTDDDGIYLGELQPSVKLAEEPLFVETPYTRDDFFKRWYPNRQEQLANNLAFLRSDRSGWPFGQKKRALKNVEGYTQSMLRNMDENLKEYSLIPSIWSSAYPHNSAYDPNRKWYFPDALKDDEARKVLEDHVRSKKQVLKNYGVNTDDKITDNDLRGESYGNYGFSYSNDPYHIFYSSAWPSDDTIVHERTHTLRPLPGEYEKYGRYFGNTPMEFVAQDIKTDQRYHKFLSDKLVDNLYTKEGRENEDIKYLSNPHEIVARLNAIRFNLGINPNRTITSDDLKEIRARASKYDKETFLDLYTDEALLRFFNEIAANNGYVDMSNIAASGGPIHIKPENRGKFTALKKRTGHSASWFKAHGTPAQKKMAVFALNAKKWKHGDGGFLDRYAPEDILAAIANIKSRREK